MHQKLLLESGSREERLAKLIASQDPMTFQALAVSDASAGYTDFNSFDPSDEGELARIAERNPAHKEEPLNEYEQSFLDELGFGPEFI